MSDGDHTGDLERPVVPTDWTDPQQLKDFSKDLEEIFRLLAERLLELVNGIRECTADLEALDARVTTLEAQAFREIQAPPH
jgi:hypothetical protein